MIEWQARRERAITGLGLAEPPARAPLFPVAPAEAFRESSGFAVGGAPARAIAIFASRRSPPHGWRRGVPLPPTMVREEAVFAVGWAGVEPLADTHGEVGLLDPASVLADRAGEPLPGAGALVADAAAMLEELGWLAAERPVAGRVVRRLAQMAALAGVGTPAGIRLRRGLTHVQWPLLAGAEPERVAEVFLALAGRGLLAADGSSLIIPWEAGPFYARALRARTPG